jgi:uncharacterized protein
MDALDRKLSKLRKTVRSLGSAAVAFSGGTDSTLVAKIALDELGKHALAVTVDSPLYPASELDAAKKLAKRIGITHVLVRLDPLADKEFVKNPPDRCYLCKSGDMKAIRRVASEHGVSEVVDGSNYDDRKDYRPGMRAKEELGIRSPLAEASLTKKEVREISRRLKLPTSMKSSSPCLASRVPYGEPITNRKLGMIEQAEETLRAAGFETVRVRAHGTVARIEVGPQEIMRLADPRVRNKITKKLKAMGFSYVSVDLEGYRMGSMNEVL